MTKKKTKKIKEIKWAQLTPLERAYQKMRKAEGYSGRFYSRMRPMESERDKREYNRYSQLLSHWCKLKRENKAQSSQK